MRRFLLLFLLIMPIIGRSAIRLPAVFTDHMVLQREVPIRVWGQASPGARIDITFAGRTLMVKAGPDQNWQAVFPPLPAGGPHTLELKGDHSQLILEDVLIGDVWICAGQSNMRWRLRDSYGADQEVFQSNNPNLRLLDWEGRLETVNRRYPLDFLQGMQADNFYSPAVWKAAGPESAPSFSAVAYYFGQSLQQATNIPIGLIHNAVGGVPLEAYLPRETMAADQSLQPLVQPGWIDHPVYPRWTAERVRQNLAAWLEEAPQTPMPQHPFAPGFLFDAAIRPLLPMPVKGVIWYQGESNATFTADSSAMDAKLNFHKLDLLINSWRMIWKNPDLYFFMVQLPAIQRDWESYREVQLQIAQQIPKTGIAVTLDLGHPRDVHPRDKRPVGERLARLALAQAYGLPLVAGGPLFRDYRVEGDKLIVRFDQAGLGTKDGQPLRHCLIAGADRRFLPATVVIRDEEIICSHPEIPNPVSVRYAWSDDPADANLINKAGLPASPFRTDKW